MEKSKINLVGQFIRQKREARGLSQRALGQMFSPPVTTQFISNLERGVTPLPPNHVGTLTKSLAIVEQEIFSLLEKEFALKLAQRTGFHGATAHESPATLPTISVRGSDFEFMAKLYSAYATADEQAKANFSAACSHLFQSQEKTA